MRLFVFASRVFLEHPGGRNLPQLRGCLAYPLAAVTVPSGLTNLLAFCLNHKRLVFEQSPCCCLCFVIDFSKAFTSFLGQLTPLFFKPSQLVSNTVLEFRPKW
jgi:hypothetical protein